MGREARITNSASAVTLYAENDTLRLRVVALENAVKNANAHIRDITDEKNRQAATIKTQRDTITALREDVARLEARHGRQFRTIAMAS